MSEEYPDHEEIIKEVLDTWIRVLDFKGDFRLSSDLYVWATGQVQQLMILRNV